MQRPTTIAWTILMALALCPCAPAEEVEVEGEAEGAEEIGAAEEPVASEADVPEEPAGPKFSKESAAADFEEGKGLFAEEKFKEAEALFKKARSGAATAEDRKLVEDWIQGTAGGLVLARLKTMEPQGKLRVYDQVMAMFQQKYRATPAREFYLSYLAELEASVFQPLEGFDSPSASYSTKYGKYFIKDPKLSLDGTMFLRWTSLPSRKAAALKVSGVPRNWGAFSDLEMWVNVTIPPRGAEAVIMPVSSVEGRGKKKTAGPMDCYQLPIKLESKKGQWNRIRVKLSDFKESGKPTMSDIAYFQIQVPAGSQFDLYIDRLALIRAEGATPPRGGASRRR